MPVTAGAVVDHSHDAIDAFGDGVGAAAGIDECDHRGLMAAQGVDEAAHRLQGAEQGAFGPALEKPLRCPGGLVGPKVLELLFQLPGAVDATVVFLQRLQRLGVAARARR